MTFNKSHSSGRSYYQRCHSELTIVYRLSTTLTLNGLEKVVEKA